MRAIEVIRTIPAERSTVWGVLADFPNIADWNQGVKTSYATGEATGGVGATRHCDLSPAGALEETVREWQPESRMVVSIDSAKMLPIRSGLVTFELADVGTATPISLRYAYETKYGIIGRLLGPLLDRQLTSGFNGFLADLEAAALASDNAG